MPISNKPWGQFKESDYTLEQWHQACLIHLHDGDPTSKAQCKLPVREPDGTVNRNGVHRAAALAGARGGVDAPLSEKRTAARKLLALYRELEEEPPASIKKLAGA
ncbi:MAG: hypothetical protein M0T85_00720 [Dehalococcoidales bacterium]|nr:hypothetical protein [Dehalococcoidales bacterium]